MDYGLVLPTQREGLILRELATPADDVAYFDSVEANREHLNQFGEPTAGKYQKLCDVELARLTNRIKLRMGIWDNDTFVGSINMLPLDDEAAKVGYWLDARHQGQGYATLAVRSIARHASRSYELLIADVHQDNVRSQRVLGRAGFVLTAIQEPTFIYELELD